MTISRRMFVGGSAAALGAVATGAILNPAQAAPAVTGAATATDVAALSGPMLVQVVDARTGTFEVLIGDQALTFTDTGLAQRLGQVAKAGVR